MRPRDTEIAPLAVRLPGAAKALSLGITATKELVATGRLRSIKVGSVRLVPVAEIRRFLGERDA
jgi:hypothetical protein